VLLLMSKCKIQAVNYYLLYLYPTSNHQKTLRALGRIGSKGKLCSLSSNVLATIILPNYSKHIRNTSENVRTSIVYTEIKQMQKEK